MKKLSLLLIIAALTLGMIGCESTENAIKEEKESTLITQEQELNEEGDAPQTNECGRCGLEDPDNILLSKWIDYQGYEVIACDVCMPIIQAEQAAIYAECDVCGYIGEYCVCGIESRTALPNEVFARVYTSDIRVDGNGNYLGWFIGCEVKNNSQYPINEVVVGYDVVLGNNIVDDRYLTFTNIGPGQYYNAPTLHSVDDNAVDIRNVRIVSVR